MICSITLAHPGRTDGNGGHYNRSTGEYHYHHGYPAHDHENGICPYAYNDKTNSNSSTNEVAKNNITNKREENISVGSILSEIVLFVLFVLPVILASIYIIFIHLFLIYDWIKNKFNKK